MTANPLRVLHVIGAMDRGGAETLVMNLYRNMDRNKIQFDFLVNDMDGRDYDEEIQELGGRLYQIPRYNALNYFSYKKACNSFFKSHPYPVVHGHIGLPASIYLKEAHETGAFCIAHSHAQNFPISPSELVFRACAYPTRFVADYFIACSEQAGIDRYGKSIPSSSAFHILKNGIDLNRAKFNEKSRKEIREELGVACEEAVFGHIGRLTHIKNHLFLIDVFHQVTQLLPTAHLVLAGRGDDEKNIRNKVRDLNLQDRVHFLGVRSDIPQILSAIDVFVFPSIREGLPVAVVEAQSSGARCLISTGVPELARISEQTVFEPLSSGIDTWARTAVELYRNPLESRSTAILDARNAGFDVHDSASWLCDLYLNHSNRFN